MTKNFRFYIKKRGTRRTDSRLLGNVARSLFFAVLFFGGLAFAGRMLATLVIPEWRVNHQFRKTNCIVLSKRILEVERRGGDKQYRPEVQILYDVAGNSYQARTYDIARAISTDREAQERAIEPFERGREYPCWYDPQDPATAVLVRGYTWPSWLLLFVPLTFVAGGFSGLAITLLNWGKSVERRAVLAQQTLPLEFLSTENGSQRDHPTIPHHLGLIDSPGTHLRYRLPLDTRPTWILVTLLAGSLVVLGAAIVFAAMTAASFNVGRPDLLMSAFVALWILLGAAGAVIFTRRLISATAAAPTVLEISDHPLHPGRPYQLFLSQRGRAKLKELAVRLVCEEKVTCQQGTNTRREARRVLELTVGKTANLQLARRNPFEARYELHVPARAMHSFRTTHNAIEWKLCVTGALESTSGFERTFPVIVYPDGEVQ